MRLYLSGQNNFGNRGCEALVRSITALMSETLGIPIRLLETAGEGGPWGMAVLAAYRYYNKEQKIKFDKFIEKVFKGA